MTRELPPDRLEPGRLVYLAVLTFPEGDHPIRSRSVRTGYVPGVIETIAGERVVIRELLTNLLRILPPGTPLEGDRE